MYPGYGTDGAVDTRDRKQGQVIERPVIDIAVDARRSCELVTVQLLADTIVSAALLRKLLGITRQRIGDRSCRTGKHILLSCTEGALGLADELATGPGQEQRQQADEQKLPPERHPDSLGQPAISHSVYRFDGIEVAVDRHELAAYALDV